MGQSLCRDKPAVGNVLLNGFAGTAPDQQEIRMTGTAVWAVREDGKLLSNHVERAALEQYLRLSAS